MKRPTKLLLYWTPRVLCMLFAAFLALFAFDVKGEGMGIWETALGVLMQLAPTTLLVLVILVLSWRREWIGGIAFIFLGLFYMVWTWGKPFGTWSTYLILSGPLVLTGILFLFNWRYRRDLRPDA